MMRTNSSYSTFSDGDNVNDNGNDDNNEREGTLLSLPNNMPPPDPTSGEVLFVKLVFYMLGIGFLLPWNAFISAETYFLSRFTKSTCDNHSNSFNRFLFQMIDSDTTSTSTNTINLYANNDDNQGNNDNNNNDNDNGGGGGGQNFMSWLGLLYNLSGVLTLVFLLLQQRAKELTQQHEQSQLDSEGDGDDNNDIDIFNDNDESNIDNMNEDHNRERVNQQQQGNTTVNTTPNSANNNRNTDADADTNTDANNTSSKQKQTIITSFSINLLIMILTSALVLVPSFNNSYTTIRLFEIITYITIISYGTVGAFLSTAILSYANTFFKYYTDISVQCFISGQAVGGVVISILNLVLDFMVDGGSRENSYWNENCYDTSIGSGGIEKDPESRNLLLPFTNTLSVPSSSLSSSSSSILLETSSMVTAACHKYNIDWGAFSYFTVCCIFLLLCIVLYMMLDANPVLHYYRYYCCGIGASNRGSAGSDTDAHIDIDVLQENQHVSLANNHHTDAEQQEQIGTLIEPLLQSNENHQDQNDASNNRNNRVNRSSSITLYVFKSIQLPILSIFLTFCITLTLFPSWTGKLQSALQCQSGSSRLRNDLFIPLMIVLFNVFDLCGRMSSGFVMTHLLQPNNTENCDNDDTSHDDNNRQAQHRQQIMSLHIISKKITFLSVLRIIFLPTFLLCKTDNPSHSVGLFYQKLSDGSGSDVYTFLLMILFAFSNGLVSTLSFIHAATLIPTSNSTTNTDDGNTIEKENLDDDVIQKVASTLLNFSVGIGLLLGSLCSFAYDYIGVGF